MNSIEAVPLPLFTELPRETVRKAPISTELKPQKAMKTDRKALFSAPGAKRSFRGYSRPFSDSF